MEYHFNFKYAKLFVLLITISAYFYFFYHIVDCSYVSDFTSFYASTIAAKDGGNPYLSFVVHYPNIFGTTSINLNPPILFLLFYPFTWCTYAVALYAWLMISVGTTLLGGWIAFKIAFSTEYLKKHWLILFVVFLLLFHNLLDFLLNQLGGLIMLFIISGYYYYLRRADYRAGILWGFIIALKFFPGLLFLFVLKENRIKVLVSMAITIACCFLLPLLVFGSTIYEQFFNIISGVSWYNFSWNASLLKFLDAVFISLNRMDWVAPLYVLLSAIFLISYILVIVPNKKGKVVNHQAFCLTLVLMIMLCPLGWLYYFPVLLLPVALLWAGYMNEQEPISFQAKLWLVSLFFLHYPLSRHASTKPVEFSGINIMIPINFVGLAILFYLLAISRPKLASYNAVEFNEEKNHFVLFTAIIIAFTFFLRFFNASSFFVGVCKY